MGSDPVMKITLNKNTFLLKLPEMSEILSDGRDYDVTFAVHREKRSLSANGYLWALCERLSKKLGIGKEEVYRRQIKEVGVCEFVAVPERAYDRLIESWGAQGIGWFAELVCLLYTSISPAVKVGDRCFIAVLSRDNCPVFRLHISRIISPSLLNYA